MAQVIYIPPYKSMGESVGEGLSGALSGMAARYSQAMQMRQLQGMEADIINSPDRATALDKLTKLPFQSPQQMAMAKMWLDDRFPKPDMTPREVTAYDPKTGESITKFVPTAALGQTGTPEGMNQIFGRGDVTLSKPDVQEFYQISPEGSYKAMGRYPVKTRPEGAYTMDELKLIEKQKSDQRAIENAQRADKRLELALLGKQTKEGKDATAKKLANTKAYNAQLANLMNIKKSIGANGQIMLDFEGDAKKAEAYTQAVERGTEYIDKYGGDINKASVNALKETGYYDKPAEAQTPAAAPEPKKGLLQSLFSPEPSPLVRQPKAAAPAPAQSQDKFEAGKVYTDAGGNKAKYLGNGKWEPM